MPVLPGAEPFTHDGTADLGVLLCRGFTSTPRSMRVWGEHLASNGIAVRCPRLPGHGTIRRELDGAGGRDWYDAVEREPDDLADRCSSVFVLGRSTGATPALRSAQQRPELTGLVLVNPSLTTSRSAAALLPLLSRVRAAGSGIAWDIARQDSRELACSRLPLRAASNLGELGRTVRGERGRAHQPLPLFRSAHDHVVEPMSATTVPDGVRSADLTEAALPDSSHAATLDHDAQSVFAGSVEPIRKIHSERVGESA